MMFIIYLIFLALLLILFILFTAIGLTFKLKILSLGEKKEFGGIFTVKWLFFSRTFSMEEPEEKETLFEEPEKSNNEIVSGVNPERGGIGSEGLQPEKGPGQNEARAEDLQKTEYDMQVEKSREIEEKEDKTKYEEEITTREMLHWGLEAFKSLRKPLFRLFSDLFKGIKIRRLESYLTFGLSDPADTGILCGFIHSIAGLIYSRCSYCSFSINPVFMCPVLDFRGNGEVHVKIHSLIFPFIKFILNGKTLSFTYSIAKEILQRKWKSEWKFKLKSKWKFKRKANSEAL